EPPRRDLLPMKAMQRSVFAAALAAALLAAGPAHALFSDDEARRAILDLRQRVEQQRQQIDDLRRATEENAALRRSLLELQNQIETLRSEIARMRGSDEEIARNLSE